MYGRVLATIGVAGVVFAGTAGMASATDHYSGGKNDDKVTICHATGSKYNPYTQITVSKSALKAHRNHHGQQDIIPAPSKGCKPKPPGHGGYPPPTTTPTTPPGPSVPCVVGPGVTQTATTVTGSPGNDTIDCTNASPGKTITGGDGNDTITGTAFNDNITAGNGNDTVTGGPGDDRIEGGNGDDTLTGSAGNDTVTDVGDGNDTITP